MVEDTARQDEEFGVAVAPKEKAYQLNFSEIKTESNLKLESCAETMPALGPIIPDPRACPATLCSVLTATPLGILYYEANCIMFVKDAFISWYAAYFRESGTLVPLTRRR